MFVLTFPNIEALALLIVDSSVFHLFPTRLHLRSTNPISELVSLQYLFHST